jgi:hypothetical protein
MAVTTRECSAVTGACLATRRSLFEELGGFDETLGVDLNDIDYCLRVWGSGRRVVYESTAELLHYESPSRGTAGAIGDIIRFVERWKGSILAGDAYLNPHLTRVDSSCALRDPGEEMWWQQWHAGLSQMTHDDHLGKVCDRARRSVTEPPAMFRRPSDAPEPLVPLRNSAPITTLHAEWARVHAPADARASLRHRLGRRVRALSAKIGLGYDPNFVGELVRALDAIAVRCDQLADRVSDLEMSIDDLSGALGEEVTRLRAAVDRTSPGSSARRERRGQNL